MLKSLLASLLLFVPCIIFSQPLVTFDTIIKGLTQPVDIVEVNDSTHRLFIVERTGKIKIWNGASLEPTAFLDISAVITTSYGEQGLLSLAFPPDYLTTGYFFVYYTNTAGSITIARYTRSTANVADAASGVVLMTIPKKYQNHNGGKLTFGPDGYLYFGTGDGGSGGDPDNNAQTGSSLLGKLLRIDVSKTDSPYYSIPATNPYASSTTIKHEIIAVGLRNPWRYSFDKQNGNLWIADVGQDAWEEVNVVTAANVLDRNYGWNCFEGTHQYKARCTAQPNNVSPIFEYPHNNATGGFSITGGYVYRGSEFPALQGYYLFADYVSSNGWLTKPDGSGGWITTQQRWPANLSSFGETANGALYALSLNGILYKVRAASALPVRLVSFTGKATGGKYEINWQVQNEEPGDVYVVESRRDIAGPFSEVIKSAAGNPSHNYNVKVPAINGDTYYRLRIISLSGQVTYSQILLLHSDVKNILKAYVSGKNLKVMLPSQSSYAEVMDAAGKVFSRQVITGGASQLTISLEPLAKGVVLVRVLVNGGWQTVQAVY